MASSKPVQKLCVQCEEVAALDYSIPRADSDPSLPVGGRATPCVAASDGWVWRASGSLLEAACVRNRFSLAHSFSLTVPGTVSRLRAVHGGDVLALINETYAGSRSSRTSRHDEDDLIGYRQQSMLYITTRGERCSIDLPVEHESRYKCNSLAFLEPKWTDISVVTDTEETAVGCGGMAQSHSVPHSLHEMPDGSPSRYRQRPSHAAHIWRSKNATIFCSNGLAVYKGTTGPLDLMAAGARHPFSMPLSVKKEWIRSIELVKSPTRHFNLPFPHTATSTDPSQSNPTQINCIAASHDGQMLYFNQTVKTGGSGDDIPSVGMRVRQQPVRQMERRKPGAAEHDAGSIVIDCHGIPVMSGYRVKVLDMAAGRIITTGGTGAEDVLYVLVKYVKIATEDDTNSSCSGESRPTDSKSTPPAAARTTVRLFMVLLETRTVRELQLVVLSNSQGSPTGFSPVQQLSSDSLSSVKAPPQHQQPPLSLPPLAEELDTHTVPPLPSHHSSPHITARPVASFADGQREQTLKSPSAPTTTVSPSSTVPSASSSVGQGLYQMARDGKAAGPGSVEWLCSPLDAPLCGMCVDGADPARVYLVTESGSVLTTKFKRHREGRN
ncbi:unnamed protein product [Vitrella brassicaformis CCMP3155]|uniref:Uncharacterized protein n=1 Tax=Vitrella brassicaformis (strain CCMP3155) TaxID=1169540 RepID=A0A0G4H0Z4_VITBC|nr:unnamed protein product [Vitrella brassicaformis CCMP3155]|eukprot:CEM37158.1 unnamed protein product [Vitrella brassicaformis CCMP3155]